MWGLRGCILSPLNGSERVILGERGEAGDAPIRRWRSRALVDVGVLGCITMICRCIVEGHAREK